MRKAYLRPHGRSEKVYEVFKVVYTEGACVPSILSASKRKVAALAALHESVSMFVSQLTCPVKLVDGHRPRTAQRKYVKSVLFIEST